MWIRSQNREVLVYADKLYISKENDKYTINFDTCDDSWYCLGTYKSKERAIEVLDDIQSFVENNYISVDDMPSHNNSVYPSYYPRCFTMTRKKFFKMPEE